MPNAPTNLRCENETNPLGLDSVSPRLSWWVNDPSHGAIQSAYHVQVAASKADLKSGTNLLWDSGEVQTEQSVLVDYTGPAMKSRQQCYWRVRTWDASGNVSPWSEIATWEMGFLKQSDWKAKWIASPIVGGPYTIPPVPHLRKTFAVKGKIVSARLYATALGLYEFEINAKRVTDAIFTPGRTEYKKRVPYHVFDVTKLIRAGKNACGAMLGDGWYCGHVHSDPRQYDGDRPKFLAQLEITFANGKTQTIITDGTWKAGEGPIRSSDILQGEDYDARMEIPGWSTSKFDDKDWRKVLLVKAPKIRIVAHRAPPVRRTIELVPPNPPVISANKRRRIYDLGQNMVGRVRLKVVGTGRAGKTVSMRFVEMLDKDGKPYTTALRTARATDHYTIKGKPIEYFEPRFTWHGFRYVEVRDLGEPLPDAVTGIVFHSDTPKTGEFECSDPMINQLQSNITWSQRGNFIDIPTDCPQRDERLGWTGDAQVFARTAAFNMDVQNFFTKWMDDVCDAQFATGGIPSTVPFCQSIANEGGPAWSDAAVIIPWTMYLCYGDKRILETNYTMMQKFVAFLRTSSNNFIRADETNKWRGYGDWLSVGAETPKDLIGTAFFAYDAALLAGISRVLGKEKEAGEYESLLHSVRTAWQEKYLNADGSMIHTTQTACVLALHFDLLPKESRAKVFAQLVADIEAHNTHLSTGFVGTPYLTHVLTDNGRADIAHALLQQKTFPGWLFPITHGATTMWERWDGWTPEKGFNDAGMNSYNHYAYGAVGAWMYAVMAGIDLDPAGPGFKRIIIRPTPGKNITHARASLKSPYGMIESGWKIADGMFNLKVAIPANTTATIRIPAADVARIKINGEPISASNLVQHVWAEANSVSCEAGAGTYDIVVSGF